MINRNAYHNAMRCGTLLSPLLGVTLRPSTPLYATQRFVYYQRRAPQRSFAKRHSTQRFVYYFATLLSSSLRITPRLCAPRLYSTICLLSTPLYALLRNSSPLYSTICLLRRSDTPRGSAQRNTTPLNATQLNLNQPIGEHNVPTIATNYKNMRYVS